MARTTAQTPSFSRVNGLNNPLCLVCLDRIIVAINYGISIFSFHNKNLFIVNLIEKKTKK